MAIAVVQSTSAHAESAISCTTPSITTTTGNLFILDASYYGELVSTITDSKSNSYATAVADVDSAADAGGKQRQVYKENGAGGASHTFTLTMASSAGFIALAVKEVSGAVTSSALDKTASKNNNSGTTGLTSTATATTAQADELLAGATSFSDVNGIIWTPQSGFSTNINIQHLGGSGWGILSASKVVTATGAYAFTYDIDSAITGNIGIISTWKAAAAAAQRMTKPKIFLQAAHRAASW